MANGFDQRTVKTVLDKAGTLTVQMNVTHWGRGGSIGRVSTSSSNGFYDQGVESRPEHNKKIVSFPESKCCADSLSVLRQSVSPPPTHTLIDIQAKVC